MPQPPEWLMKDNVKPIQDPNVIGAPNPNGAVNITLPKDPNPMPTDYVDPQDTLLQEVPETPPVPLDALLLNLTDAQQQELVTIIKEDYNNAMEARDKRNWGKKSSDGTGLTFDEKYAGLIDLYEGDDEKRPEQWMCGRSLKISQAIIEMAVARLFPMVYNEDTIKWRPVRYTNRNYVELVNKMMYWVVTVWMKGQKDALLYIRNAAMLGSVFAEAWWKREPRDMGQTQQIPVLGPDGQPLMNEQGQPVVVEQKLMAVDEKPQIRIIPVGKVLLQPGATTMEDDSVIVIEDYTYRELAVMQKQGLAQNITDKLKEDVDTRLVTEFGLAMDKAEDVADLNAKRRNMPIECLRWMGKYDADGDGFDEDIIVSITNKDEVFIRAYLTAKISRTGKRPLIHKNFMDRIGGKMLGIGLLEQVKPLAEEIDACFRQMTDANTMSVMRWGFYDPNSDYDPDEHVAKPRAMYPVSNPQQNVYFPDIQIPIERLLNAIKMVEDFIERLTAASSYVMGKESDVVGGSGTATRTQAIMSSADTRFNLPATNLRIGLAELYTDVFNLLSMNCPEGLEEKILGAQYEKIFNNQDASMTDALALEMECYLAPAADLGDSNTRRQLASMLYDKLLLGMNPLITSDPNRIWFATANYLRAYGEEPMEWIGKPASVKPTNDPFEEHTLIRDGRYCPVEPQENHMEHIQVHTEEIKGPNVLLWPPDKVQYLQQHIQEHIQMMQRVMAAMVQQKDMQSQQGKGGTGGEANGGAAPNQKGGAAIVGGQPDVSAAPNQASGTPAQQASGAAGGGV